MLVFFIQEKYDRTLDLMMGLGLRPGDMNYKGNTSLVDVFAKRHELRTVGELYDFLCEHGLATSADHL